MLVLITLALMIRIIMKIRSLSRQNMGEDDKKVNDDDEEIVVDYQEDIEVFKKGDNNNTDNN